MHFGTWENLGRVPGGQTLQVGSTLKSNSLKAPHTGSAGRKPLGAAPPAASAHWQPQQRAREPSPHRTPSCGFPGTGSRW